MKGFFHLISTVEFGGLLDRFAPLTSETVALDQALGRVLAADLSAPEPLPPFARSTMDGFAVRGRDTFGCSESEPALLAVRGEIAMGESVEREALRPGEAARIWTGGRLPPKADAVVMVEHTNALDEASIEVFRPVAPMENVIRAGEDFEQGALVLAQGQRLRPQDLGVIAGLGILEVEVFRRPRVAILSTGDELVPPGERPGSGQIRDINSTTLSGLVAEAGGLAERRGIVGDDPDAMYAACRAALDDGADVLLISGGSSVGRRDFTLAVLERIEGGELLAHGVAIRPGKPTILARAGNRALLGLPGHAGSVMVVFYLFVRPLLRRLSGLPTDLGLVQVQVRTAIQIPSAIGREEYVRVRLEDTAAGPLLAWPVYGKSGLLNTLVRAQGLLRIARDSEGLDQNQEAEVLLFP